MECKDACLFSTVSVSFRSYNYPKQYITVTASKEIYISTDSELPYRSFTLTN